VTVTWSGGDPDSYVSISGSSSSSATANGANDGAAAVFLCYAPVGAGQFTVPSYVLLGMPAGMGTLNVINATTPAPFAAFGLDYAYAIAEVFFAILPPYQ
jgi:hypothetical protein